MKRDSAVSPVIGSILLVAITVIIAAVIAAFVFGMTGDIQQTRVVAITSDISQNTGPTAKVIVITNHGGKDASVLKDLEIKVEGTPCTVDDAGATINTTALATIVGSSVRCKSLDTNIGKREHLVVTGIFIDGTRQVLLDTYQ